MRSSNNILERLVCEMKRLISHNLSIKQNMYSQKTSTDFSPFSIFDSFSLASSLSFSKISHCITDVIYTVYEKTDSEMKYANMQKMH